MGFSLASIGSKARDTLPFGRLLRNAGVLSTDPVEASAGADAAPSPVDGQPKQRSARRLRDRLKPSDGFQDRLSDWWHGRDPSARTAPSEMSEVDETFAAEQPEWSRERTRVCELLWGETFIEPGGPSAARRLFTPVMPTSKHSVLDLAAGMGGTALTLASGLNLWMDAFEPNPVLAKRAARAVQLSGYSKQVPIVEASFEEMQIEARKFNLIYARDRLFTCECKIDLLDKMSKGLKPGGQVFITDYVLGSDQDTENLEAWRHSEPAMPNAWTLGLYARTLESCGLNVWARHNLTDEYLANIYASWNRAIGNAASPKFDRALGDHLLREGEIWSGRTRALEAGDLVYCRIIAQKE